MVQMLPDIELKIGLNLHSPLLIHSHPSPSCSLLQRLTRLWLGLANGDHQQETGGREQGEFGIYSSSFWPAFLLSGSLLHTARSLVLVSTLFYCPSMPQDDIGAPLSLGTAPFPSLWMVLKLPNMTCYLFPAIPLLTEIKNIFFHLKFYHHVSCLLWSSFKKKMDWWIEMS